MSEELDFVELKGERVIPISEIPMRKWRCTRGHTWEAPYEISGWKFITELPNSFNPMAIEAESFCMRCCYEWLREYCGKVREVK